MKKFTSNIITSRSVFSFPILDDVFVEAETNDNSLNNKDSRKWTTYHSHHTNTNYLSLLPLPHHIPPLTHTIIYKHTNHYSFTSNSNNFNSILRVIPNLRMITTYINQRKKIKLYYTFHILFYTTFWKSIHNIRNYINDFKLFLP